MIGVIVAVILGILLIGVLLKILKIAVVIALCVGLVLIAQNALGAKRLK